MSSRKLFVLALCLAVAVAAGQLVADGTTQRKPAEPVAKSTPEPGKGKRAQALGLPQTGPTFQRVETKAVCSGCQRETTVPFKPTQGRPVFCRECFQARRSMGAA